MKGTFFKMTNLPFSLVLALLLFLGGRGENAKAAELKIGYVDMQYALQNVNAGKKAKESLEKEFNRRKEQLDKKKAEIEKKGQDLGKKKSILSNEVFNKKNMELQEEAMKLQRSAVEEEMELQKKQKELIEPIVEKLKKSIEKISKEKGITLVLEKQSQILYSVDEYNLTEQVIKSYEQ